MYRGITGRYGIVGLSRESNILNLDRVCAGAYAVVPLRVHFNLLSACRTFGGSLPCAGRTLTLTKSPLEIKMQEVRGEGGQSLKQ